MISNNINSNDYKLVHCNNTTGASNVVLYIQESPAFTLITNVDLNLERNLFKLKTPQQSVSPKATRQEAVLI